MKPQRATLDSDAAIAATAADNDDDAHYGCIAASVAAVIAHH